MVKEPLFLDEKDFFLQTLHISHLIKVLGINKLLWYVGNHTTPLIFLSMAGLSCLISYIYNDQKGNNLWLILK